MKQDIIHSLPFRIFSLDIDGNIQYWIHRFKDEDAYRQDIKTYNEHSKNLDPETITHGIDRFLENEGYINIAELVTEEFKAELISTRSRLIESD